MLGRRRSLPLATPSRGLCGLWASATRPGRAAFYVNSAPCPSGLARGALACPRWRLLGLFPWISALKEGDGSNLNLAKSSRSLCPQSQGVPELSFLYAEMLCAFFAPKGHCFLRAVWAVSVNARPRDGSKTKRRSSRLFLEEPIPWYALLVEDTWGQGSEAKEEEEPLTLIANNAKVKQTSSRGRVRPEAKDTGVLRSIGADGVACRVLDTTRWHPFLPSLLQLVVWWHAPTPLRSTQTSYQARNESKTICRREKRGGRRAGTTSS